VAIFSDLAPVVPILALAISLASVVISSLAYRRAGVAERVVAWLELSPTPRSDWFLATMHVKNPSHLQIKLTRLITEVTPDFKIANYGASLVTSAAGERLLPKDFEVKEYYIAMNCSTVVPSDGTGSVRFLIYQASFSRKSKVRIRLMYQTMEPKPRFKIIEAVARTRSEI
jgi:hypothetical protein